MLVLIDKLKTRFLKEPVFAIGAITTVAIAVAPFLALPAGVTAVVAALGTVAARALVSPTQA